MEKPTKRAKFDAKGCFAKIKYPIPAVVNLSNNVNLLPSISIHLPMDKGSHMLDLLNWSMQIGYNELNNNLKSILKGHLIESLINDSREGEYMKADEGIYRFNLELNQHFSYLKKIDKTPTPVRFSD